LITNTTKTRCRPNRT